MANIGDEFRTGERAPDSGNYGYVRHTNGSACMPTAAEREIPLSRGEVFPPHRRCMAGVVWRLLRKV